LRALVRFVCGRLSLAVVAIGTVLMLIVFFVVEGNATHLGEYPVTFRDNTNRVEVQAGSPLGDALRTGDRIDLSKLTPEERFSLIGGAPVGSELTVQVQHGRRSYPLRLTTSETDYSERARLTRDIGIPLCFFLSLGLASALFLMQPRAITFAFYIYTLLMLLKVNQSALELATWPMNFVSDLGIQIIYPLAQIMILVFAQRLYGRPSRMWPWFFGGAITFGVLGFLIWSDPIIWVVYQRFGFPGPVGIMMGLIDCLLLVTLLSGLAYIASGASGLERRRVSWVIAGISLAPILDLTWAVANVISVLIGDTSQVLLNVQDWTDVLLPWFGLVGSVFVLYGFLSQRVVDLRFVIGRAVLYGSATLILVLFFGVIEWWAEQIFESTKPAIYVSLFAALAIGFGLNAVHGRIEELLNDIFFREQRDAENSLRRTAKALANTSSEHTLVEFLIEEPVRVLGLSSTALFLAVDGNGFVRKASHGWNDNEVERFDAEDPLLVTLRAEMGAIQLDGRQLASVPLPHGRKTPSFIIPLIMRGNLFGFVFYGSRSDGIPLTSDEQQLLERIALNAAAAYDHIDAERSRARIHTLEERLLELGAAVPE
jgi:hypothetical protein